MDREHMLRLLIKAGETEYGQAIFAATRQLLEEAQTKMNHKAIISDSSPKDDWRCYKGLVMAYEKVLNLPFDAKQELTNLNQEV